LELNHNTRRLHCSNCIMFSSILLDGLCNGQRCNSVSYDTYVCNAKAFAREFKTKESGTVYTSESAEGVEHFIPHTEIAAALAHQHWIEERMEKRYGACDTSLRRSMSFAESTLSSSQDSSYNSVFSASTAITGHTNKYGIPTVTTPSSSPKRKSKNRVQRVSSRDRYATRASARGSNDWDYKMDVKMDHEVDLKKSALKSVVHLKMNAQMSDFYREDFLLSFPQFPIPKEMDMRKVVFQSNWGSSEARARKRSIDYVPGLIKSASSMSSSSEQSSAFPTTNAFTPVLLAVDSSSFLDVAVSGCLGLIDSHSRKASPACRNQNKNYLMIGNRQSGKPMLVCFLKSTKGKPDVRIYATRPRIPEQEPITKSDELGITEEPFPLYSWAELRIESEFPDENAKYFLHMSTGAKNRFQRRPLYSAYHECAGSTDLTVLRRKEDREGKGSSKDEDRKSEFLHCARVCVRTDSSMCNQETSYMISVVKDAGFANILAMVAIIDELIEFAMRKKCAMQAWKFAAIQKNDVCK
jgi:hypothetical protein